MLAEASSSGIPLKDLAYDSLKKLLEDEEEIENVLKELKPLEDFRGKVMGMAAVNVVVDRIRDFLAHAGIAWTLRPRGGEVYLKAVREVIKENKREVIGLSSAYLKDLAKHI